MAPAPAIDLTTSFRGDLTPPTTHTHPKKWHLGKGGGVQGSKSKNSLGDNFVSQNDAFRKGWASDIIRWGMLREWGMRRLCLRLRLI